MSEPGTEAPGPEPEERLFEQAEQAASTDPINSQITAGVDAANAAADGTAQPSASLDHVIAQAAGLAMLNAVNAQHNAYITANATVAAVVARILGAEQALPPTKADHV